MRRFVAATLVLALVGWVNIARAADTKEDPTGTWKWAVKFGQGDNRRSIDMTLKLKLEGDKLTGSMLGRNGKETAIDDAQFKDNEVSFKVTREMPSKDGGSRKRTTKYSGKLSGDTIKGKAESGTAGRSRDWEAKRVKS